MCLQSSRKSGFSKWPRTLRDRRAHGAFREGGRPGKRLTGPGQRPTHPCRTQRPSSPRAAAWSSHRDRNPRSRFQLQALWRWDSEREPHPWPRPGEGHPRPGEGLEEEGRVRAGGEDPDLRLPLAPCALRQVSAGTHVNTTARRVRRRLRLPGRGGRREALLTLGATEQAPHAAARLLTGRSSACTGPPGAGASSSRRTP